MSRPTISTNLKKPQELLVTFNRRQLDEWIRIELQDLLPEMQARHYTILVNALDKLYGAN